MKSKAALFGHPLHPVLIVLPLGLLPAAFLADLVFHATADGSWARIAFWLIVGGLGGGVIAGVFGFVDWKALPPGTRARKIGAAHGITNLVVLATFGLSLVLRANDPASVTSGATVLAGLGLLLATWGVVGRGTRLSSPRGRSRDKNLISACRIRTAPSSMPPCSVSAPFFFFRCF